MSKAQFILIAVIVLMVTQACSRRLDPEDPCNFVQSSEKQRVSWKDDLPVKLMVHASVPREAYADIEASVKHWNDVMYAQGLKKPAFVIDLWGVGGPIAPRQDFNNMIYWMDNWEPDLAFQQARTTIYWTGSRIYEADIRINTRDHQYSFHSTAGLNRDVDFQSLMVHELGHVLGLAHTESSQSVMQTELAGGVERRALGSEDMDAISCEYN